MELPSLCTPIGAKVACTVGAAVPDTELPGCDAGGSSGPGTMRHFINKDTDIILRFAVLKLITPIISIIVTAVVINELADTFDSVKNLNNALTLVVYSYTPILLVDIIVSISWALGFLSFLGLYGVYLFWVGLPRMMDTPEDRRLVYIIAAVVVVLLLNVVISAFFGIDRLGYY